MFLFYLNQQGPMSFVMNPIIAFEILCALGALKDSGPFTNIASLTLS